MIKAGRMTEEGLLKFKQGIRDNKELLDSGITSNKEIVIPWRLEKSLKKNKKAWENFNNFPDSYKKRYLYWYMDAKREDTRSRRMEEIIKRSEKNQKSVMG